MRKNNMTNFLLKQTLKDFEKISEEKACFNMSYHELEKLCRLV